MNGSTGAQWRRLRGGMVAALATVLAAAGHTFGGGRLPDVAVLAPAAATLGWASSGLARKRLRFPILLALLMAAQIGFHLLFLLQMVPSTSNASMPGMSMPAAGGSSWPVMVGFHALAAVVTAAVLAGGEKALSALAEPIRLIRRLAAPHRLSPVRTSWWTATVSHHAMTRRAAPARGPAPRRGPPGSLLSI